MPEKVIMPQLGESVVEGTVTKWLKKEGEPVKNMEALLEVSTDKVDTEIPSPADGVLLKILIADGLTVHAGTLLAWIGQTGEAIPEDAGPAAKAAAPAGKIPSAAVEPAATPPSAGRSADLGFISPVVARLARENQVDLAQVYGTGEGGRITKKDVLAFLEKKPAAAAAAAPAWETPGEGDLFRPTEMMFPQTPAAPAKPPAPASPPAGGLLPLTTVRKTIAARMIASVQTAPHVTTVMEADLNRVVAHREAHKAEFEAAGARLTFTAYFITAIVKGLKAFPLMNSSWSEEGIRLHKEINIGMAVSLGDEGLIVPVIKDAENLSLLGLARSIHDLSERARGRALKPDEVQNATFTLTNHGTGGSLFATPIISQPQSGILGAGAIQKRAVVVNDAIAIRPMVYLSLTFDHRIMDGAGADAFLSAVAASLENWV